MNGQEEVETESPIHALAEIISPLRLGTYLNAAGHDADRALRLYLWNAKIGESFHLPIQAVEVGLRNRVSDGLAAEFGHQWWSEPAYLRLIGAKREGDIEEVKRRLGKQNKKVETGQIIAGLSFGFWVAMLDGAYNPRVWSKHLYAAFPHLPPAVTRQYLRNETREVNDLRNRLWHHEPVFRRNLNGDYSRCIKLVGWLCPTKVAWIKPHCRFPQVMREKP